LIHDTLGTRLLAALTIRSMSDRLPLTVARVDLDTLRVERAARAIHVQQASCA